MAHAGITLGKLPNPKQVDGLQVFAESAETSQLDTQNVAMINRILSQLAGNGSQSASKEAQSISPGPGFPAVSKKLTDKIWRGEYVEFSDLPPARGRVKSIPHSEGHIVVVQAADLVNTRKVIPDLATWVQCFTLYMAIVVKQEPERASFLLAYMAEVARASMKYRWPSWVVYDKNFRQAVAESGLKDWSNIEPSIYSQCFTRMRISQEGWCKHCESIDHTSEGCPLRSMARKRPHPMGGYSSYSKRPTSAAVCIKFNKYDGDCKFGRNCKYQHVCSTCQGAHPVPRCPGQEKQEELPGQ